MGTGGKFLLHERIHCKVARDPGSILKNEQVDSRHDEEELWILAQSVANPYRNLAITSPPSSLKLSQVIDLTLVNSVTRLESY